MQNVSEPELIAQSLNENHIAYAELVDRYKNAVYHHSFAIVRDEDVAEDIVQDTFISAYYKLSTYNSDYRLSTWLFKIATNKALNWLKRSNRVVRVDEDVIAAIPSDDPGPHELGLRQDVRCALGKLRPQYRAVISLYYWQGLAYDEIAMALGAPLGSVKSWMRRAKDELRKELL